MNTEFTHVVDFERGTITAEQYDVLRRPLAPTRVASRNQGGKQLSYLESWDVRAHLIRLFGFGNFDVELLDYGHVADRDYMSSGDNPKPMVEVIWRARVSLTVRDQSGRQIARYVEGACGSASGPASMLGDHHDNALKTAESDALKRCAINLGTQFGLSLYDHGNKSDVVRQTVVTPKGATPDAGPTKEQAAALAQSVGSDVKVTPTGEDTNEAATEDRPTEEEKAAMTKPPAEPSDEEDAKRRREMFAKFSDAGFTATGDDARTERLGYCAAVLDREIESSNDLSYDEVVKVINSLDAVIEADKAGAR